MICGSRPTAIANASRCRSLVEYVRNWRSICSSSSANTAISSAWERLSVAGLIFEIFVGVEVIEIVVVIGVVDELIVGVPHTTTSFQSPSPAKWDRHERTATFVALEQPLDFNRRCALTSLAVRHHK